MGIGDRFRESQARAKERRQELRDEWAEERGQIRERHHELKGQLRETMDDNRSERERINAEGRAKIDKIRADREADRDERRGHRPPSGRRQKLSEAGDRASGTLACPNCGGDSFKARRSAAAKVIGGAAVGVGALAAPKSRVQCVTCGETYKRG